MDHTDWWTTLEPGDAARLAQVWIPVGTPGFAGASKTRWREILDQRFGDGGWRLMHVVRGTIVPPSEAIVEYEAAYRHYLRDRPALVGSLTSVCGNVYDWDVANVLDDAYQQPDTAMNHYQDISVRRVIAELVDDPEWPDVVETPVETVAMIDLGSDTSHVVPRARGFRGDRLCQIREPWSPGYALSPAVVPAHDPALLAALPGRTEWYHAEGSGHLSIEAFWQGSKVIEVRLDRFLASGAARSSPLDGL